MPPKIFFRTYLVASLAVTPESNGKEPDMDLKLRKGVNYSKFNSDNKQNVFQNNKQFQKQMVQVYIYIRIYIYISWLLDATKLIKILLPISTLEMLTCFLDSPEVSPIHNPACRTFMVAAIAKAPNSCTFSQGVDTFLQAGSPMVKICE